MINYLSEIYININHFLFIHTIGAKRAEKVCTGHMNLVVFYSPVVLILPFFLLFLLSTLIMMVS